MATTKVTPDDLDRVVEALRQGADMALAAQSIGCTRQTLYNHRKKNPEFKLACDEARAVADDTVVSSLYTAACSGNIVACIFWLKNRRPTEWRDRREHQIETTGDRNYTVTIPGLDESDLDSAALIPASHDGIGEPN